MSHYFVTGTDTEVGKTLISCALLLHLRKTHPRVVVAPPTRIGGSESVSKHMRARGYASAFSAAALSPSE